MKQHYKDASGFHSDLILFKKISRLFYQRALSVHEQQLGAMHPDTAIRLHNLATLYDRQGKYIEAEPLFKRALLIWIQTLGETHPKTQTVRQWYISLLRKMGRNREATAFETTGHLPSEEH